VFEDLEGLGLSFISVLKANTLFYKSHILNSLHFLDSGCHVTHRRSAWRGLS
jgi:hypothetical protein